MQYINISREGETHMETYLIHESNQSRLEKKLTTIEKKCNKNDFSFNYRITGEHFQEVEHDDGSKSIERFIVVEVEGEVKHGGWEFVAVLDHHSAGNIVRAFNTEIIIPEKYKNCGPECEHCNKIRSRKDTYLIYNSEKDEFKQVGKTCLQEFTNGLSAEETAYYVSIYDSLSAYYTPDSRVSRVSYVDVKLTLNYAWECYRHFGYEKSYYDSSNSKSTRERVSNYIWYDHCPSKLSKYEKETIREEYAYYSVDPKSAYAIKMTDESLAWIRGVTDSISSYIHNLHVICSEDYTETKNVGILVSLTTAYMHELEHRAYIERKNNTVKFDKLSEYVGNVGERITVSCNDFRCVTTLSNQFGLTSVYKFSDPNNNVYIWYSSKHIDDPESVTSVVGTVKDHSEYKGCKQTILTRCKVS